MGMKLRDIPEFEEDLKQVDQLWAAWAVGAYGRQLQEIVCGDRQALVNWVFLELAKPLALAMQDIPMDANWVENMQHAVQNLMATDRSFYAVLQAQAMLVVDLIEMARGSIQAS